MRGESGKKDGGVAVGSENEIKEKEKRSIKARTPQGVGGGGNKRSLPTTTGSPIKIYTQKNLGVEEEVGQFLKKGHGSLC